MDSTAENLMDTSAEDEPILDVDTAEAGDATANEAEESLAGKHVFISHKCDVEPDGNLARQLYSDLKALGCEVYLDEAQPLGSVFDDDIKKWIKRSDFVVALLTSAANESDWVTHEIFCAREQFRLRGGPIILPLKLGSFEPSMRIGANLSRFTIRSYDPYDYKSILKGVIAGLARDSSPRDITPLGMEGFLVREFRKSVTRAGNPRSSELQKAVETLQKHKLLWVVGDDSVRNYFARCIAIEKFDQEAKQGPDIYEIPRSRSWARVDATFVNKSIMIFPDVTSSVVFEQESTGVELESLKNLVDRNCVIITAAEETYFEMEEEMRNRGLSVGAHILVGHNFYNERAKLTIFERLLDFSAKTTDITPNQLKWARRLVEETEERKIFRQILDKWSPADIERFVLQHLPRVKRQDEAFKLLQRNAHLDDEIHAWFIALDDSTRCFVLALSMLAGLRKEQFWQKYKLVVQRLQTLDPGVSLRPLGICCERAEPYVTGEGQLDFADERIREAVYREVTRNFREYLIELVPLIKNLSVPPGREQKMTKEAFEARKPQVEESRECRVALARIIGKAARSGLEGFTDLLEFWALDPALPVREAVALSMEQSVTEPAGARQTLDLLQRWTNDRAAGSEALYKSWAGASALGSIIAARPARQTYERALDLLERLVSRNQANIQFYISISLKKAARKAPLTDGEAPVSLESLLKLVARDENASTKINVAEALCEARIANEVSALRVIEEWISGSDMDCRWAGICSRLLWRRQRRQEWDGEVIRCLNRDPQTTATVLVEIIAHKNQMILERLSQFLLKADPTIRAALVAGFSSVPQARLDDKILPLFRASQIPALSDLAIEIRAQSLARMLSTPSEFITTVQKELQQEQLAGEIFGAFKRLLKPEPDGSRQWLVYAMVHAFVEQPTNFEDVLARLKTIGPGLFDSFAVEVRAAGLRTLFQYPDALFRTINAGLVNADLRSETSAALEFLAQPEPRGHCEEMLNALASARSAEPLGVRMLLRQFRALRIRSLAEFTYEFNIQLLRNEVAEPTRFISYVAHAMYDESERVEVLQILQLLSRPEPAGQRKVLIRALGVARLSRPVEVDMLLRDSSWQTDSGILSLKTQVKLFSFLSHVLSPGITSGLFGVDD